MKPKAPRRRPADIGVPIHEWMATDARTPDKWVMPILTVPFNEGVPGAVSGHKQDKEEKK
jgi:hypothetical protein